jgi:hypothetical protein
MKKSRPTSLGMTERRVVAGWNREEGTMYRAPTGELRGGTEGGAYGASLLIRAGRLAGCEQ